MTIVSQYILFETHQIKGILIHFVFYFLNFVGNTKNIFMIPKFYEIAAPILRNLKNGNAKKTKELCSPLAKYFNLTEEDYNLEYESGNGNVFKDRISWALSYLFKLEYLERPEKSCYKITSKGIDAINGYTDEEIEKIVISYGRNTSKKTQKTETTESPTEKTIINEDVKKTQKESLEESYNRMKSSICDDLIATILRKKPEEFEKLVVTLLQAMGYGGKIENSGTVTKLSNDGGIDGIIKEDILGFDYVCIQAKRYSEKNLVGREDIQKFIGAIASTMYKKGVFITTSDYTTNARKCVEGLSSGIKIILINGRELAEYMYKYGIGLQTENTLKIMKIDDDFWDLMQDDK